MSVKIFDTHAHYNCRQFNHDLAETIDAMKETVCGCINIGTNTRCNKMVLKQGSQFFDDDFQMYTAVGFFPTDLQEFNNAALRTLAQQLKMPHVIALGEIGLDLYHATPKDIPVQTEAMIKQIELAQKMHKPVILHERNAFNEMITALKQVQGPFEGVIHSFSHGPKEAEQYAQFGLYFGFGGMCTYPNNSEILDWAAACPEDKILLETDAPYLSPVPVRRERNDSSHIRFVAECIGKRRGISGNDVIELSNQNAEKLFKIVLK